MSTPKKNFPYIFTRGLFSTANPGTFQVNPTLTAADFNISKDGGAFSPLTNTPTVTPAGSVCVRFVITGSEMNADSIVIVGSDADGEWGDLLEDFDTTTQTLDDVPTANVNADALLKRDWTLVTGSPPAYSVWNALRFLRNVWSLVAGTPPVLHVKAEDGTTDAWTRNVTTDTAAQPITGVS